MSRNTALLAGIIIIALGAVLVIAHQSIGSTGIVIAAGVTFLLAGIVSMLISPATRLYDHQGRRVHTRRGSAARAFNIVTGVAAIVLGLCMLIFQDTFSRLVPFIFGCVVALGAIIQIYILAIGVRPISLSPWFYMVPVAIAGASVYVFMQTTANDAMIMLVTGASMILFGIACFVESMLVGHKARRIPDTISSDSDNAPSSEITTLD